MKRTKMAKMKKMKMEKMMKFVKMPSHRENETLVEKREMKRVKRKGKQKRANRDGLTLFLKPIFLFFFDDLQFEKGEKEKKSEEKYLDPTLKILPFSKPAQNEPMNAHTKEKRFYFPFP